MPVIRMIMTGGWRLLAVLAFAMPGLLACEIATTETAAFAQGSAIREIRVAGNRRVEPETVRSYLQFSVGDAYDAGKVDRSLRALFATGLFSDVRIDRDGAAVVVTVAENPVINQVAFEGNKEVETKTLETEVQLKPRSVFTRARVQADVQRILDVYRRQGRFAASVEPKIIELEQNRVNLVFEISEGGATKVKGINFVGNRAFSDSQLRDIISTTQQGWFDFLKGNSIYDPDRMSLDRELVRQYYLKNGYADIRVTAATAEIDREGTGFVVTFTIEEGQLYRFGSITLESKLPGVNPDVLQSHILTIQGQVFNASYIDKTIEKLTLLTAEQGFAFARVRPNVNRDPGTQSVSIAYVIDEGPRIYIERINISGNTRTKDHIIRREIRLAEGDAFNPMLVDRAKKRLKDLGFFKTAEIKRRAGSSSDRVVLDVEVVEQSTGELSFGVGYSTAEGVIGDISLSERNLLGNGQFVRLKLGGSMERLQVDLSFTEPRFLDQNLAAGFDVFHKDVSASDSQGYSSRRTGFSPRLGFPLSENLWLQTAYTFSHDTIYDVKTGLVSRAIIEAQGSSNTSAVGAALTYDTRNHPRNPSSGSFLQVSTDVAGVGGDVQYVRTIAEGRYYYPLTDKFTFVGRVVGGAIEGWGGDDVRLIDLFFKGGETVRGFARAGYGPRDLTTKDALGGRYFWSSTAEVRFPLPFLSEEIGMSGAVFADAGSLWGAGELARRLNGKTPSPQEKALGVMGLNLHDENVIRSSVGASILWQSPVGPLRLDFAEALSKDKYDKTQFFRFGASTKF